MDAKVYATLSRAYEALIQVEMIEHTNWMRVRDYDAEVTFVCACAWCHKEGKHSASCPRQAALKAIEVALE